MSTSDDYPTEGTPQHVHPHPVHEGEYEDKDVVAGRAEPPAGEYEDHDITAPRPNVPEDEGSYADHDVVSEHRHPVAEGSFEDAEIPGEDEDVEAVQEERAQQHHPPTADPDVPPTGSGDPSTDPT